MRFQQMMKLTKFFIGFVDARTIIVRGCSANQNISPTRVRICFNAGSISINNETVLNLSQFVSNLGIIRFISQNVINIAIDASAMSNEDVEEVRLFRKGRTYHRNTFHIGVFLICLLKRIDNALLRVDFSREPMGEKDDFFFCTAEHGFRNCNSLFPAGVLKQ